ncbi:MAG: hypothetical protein K1000chlam2_00963 [Chlamydiae bacterium]|nr:hypothetical protein [Chlamydiota bacterium]
MKTLIAISLAALFVANQETSIEPIETLLFSEQEITLVPESKEEMPEYVEEVNEDTAIEILEEQKLELEPVVSLEGIVEKETAQILQSQSSEEEIEEELQPQVEDLAQLVEKPATTMAETPKAEPNPYETLPLSAEEKQKIGLLLGTLAEDNVFKLLFEKKYLERLGHDISYVHPVRFIGTVFSDPRLVYCMHQIRSSSFKWNGFIDGFSQRFTAELKANNINAYIPGLAESLNVKKEDLQAYVNYNDFEGLVVYLMAKTRNRN